MIIGSTRHSSALPSLLQSFPAGRTLIVSALLLCAAFASAAPLPPGVASALRDAGIPQDAVSVVVQETGGSVPLVSHRGEAPMNPASVMKLVTTFVALEWLGPAFTWKTEAWADGVVTDGVLDGNLVIKGYGDPKITLESLWLMLREMRQKGLREIKGDLVLDRSYFSARGHDPSRFDEQPLRAYNVGPDALLVNFKTIRFVLAPDIEQRRVIVRAEPPLPGLSIRNQLKLVNTDCGDWKGTTRGGFISNGDAADASFTGTYAIACGEQSWYVSLFDHGSYAGQTFRAMWTEMGGTLAGRVRDGVASASARLYATQTSPQLAEVIRDINKFSNNVMARQLFLTLDAQANGPPATLDRAGSTVRDWLRKRGLAFRELVIENGSGLSRIERISGEHLNQLLQAAWASPVMPEYISSFALSAVDGTMKRRLLGTGAAGQAHLKTGTLEGVRALAGYVLDAKGRRWTVVGIVNHPNAAAAGPALDALVQWTAAGPEPEGDPPVRGRRSKGGS